MPLEPKPDKDKEADERDRAERRIRARNRKGGAGYDPTDDDPADNKDTAADERDRAKEAERTRNRKGGAGYDPTDTTESFANRVFESAWQRKEGKNKEGGLNEKGRKAYERENPGSDLKAPVSAAQAKKSKGGKAAKRRKSFCARMGGMPGPMKKPNGKPTRKALALRKWDC